MFQTIVHQTLEDRNNPDEIEDSGPFKMEIGNPFLGNGYYFWDDHIDLAHWWGRNHIKRDYVICEAQLEVDNTIFYDLVGSRQDMMHFKELIRTLKLEKLAIGQIIELLKEVNSRPDKKGIFPYKVIRAIDISHSSYEQEHYKFVKDRKGETNLAPRIIICLIEKRTVPLSSYKIVYPNSYMRGN